jgi:taurine transport system substrate-binding protein
MLTPAEKSAAGISSFDIISVTESFAQEHPDLVRAFVEVTHEANAAWAADQSKLSVIAKDAGMSEDATAAQMAGFSFPTVAEQKRDYFGDGGIARSMLAFMGNMFATSDTPALSDYNVTIDTSFLD